MLNLPAELKDFFVQDVIYSNSVNLIDETYIFIVKRNKQKQLAVCGGKHFEKFNGCISGKIKLCNLDNENLAVIRELFPFVNPVSAQGREVSFGLGDRLGLASAGHIKLMKNTGVFPILAQQSIRELNLTGRTYEQVLADAC